MKWELKNDSEEKKVSHLQEVLGIDKNVSTLLVQRGLDTFEQAKAFFRPDIATLHDPFLMKGMDQAIVRIEEALGNGEKIMIYGDYDVDGTTAVSLVYSYFIKLYDNLIFYIPDRYKEGYGISLIGIDYAAEVGASLIIALDCGIRAVEQIDYANQKGIDFIICDHHLPGDVVPNAIAVLDPKQSDCDYPYKELSGCGIGFKLVQAFTQKNGGEEGELIKLLDLVAVSTACDIVPITGENRVLAYYGLEQLNKNKRPGIAAMLHLIEFKKALSITDIVFVVGPRINAAGRMHHGRMAVEMLTEQSVDKAIELCEEINIFNGDRRTLDKDITEEALSIIAANTQMIQAKTTVVFKEDWHKGVIGIVASRLIETHYRPTIVLAESNGMVTGSARSVHGFDVHAAIMECGHLLEKFGGHKYAAGLSMLPEKVTDFQELFEKVVSASITEDQLTPRLIIDLELNLSEITPKFFRLLQQFAPFGPGNMRPVFVTRKVHDSGNSRAVGADGLHLKLDVYQHGNTNQTLSGIAFNMGHLYEKMENGEPFDIVYTLEENEFRGNVTVQMKVKDIQFN